MWADQLLAPARYLSTEIVLTVFCAMFLYILRATRHSKGELAETVRAILWSVPAGYYFASLVVLNDHSAALLAFLLLLNLAGAVLANANEIEQCPRDVLGRGGSSAEWLDRSACRPGMADARTGHRGRRLRAHADLAVRSGRRRRWAAGNVDIALTHGNALFTALAAYVLVDAVRSDLTAPMIAGFALWHGVLSLVSVRRNRRVAVHFAALSFTMLAAATALRFHGAALTAAWAAEGSAVRLGLREQRGWLRASGPSSSWSRRPGSSRFSPTRRWRASRFC